MLYAIVALLVIVLDQWTKLWVTTNIQGEVIAYELIHGVLSLVNVQNDGAAFGFLAGSNASILFIAIAGGVALLTIIALATNLVKGSLGRWSLVFIAAGGLSNAIDRLMSNGSVQDMVKLDFLEKLRINFPIFNVADVFITVFCILFILYVLFGGKQKDRDEDYDDDEDEYEDELDEDEEEEDERPKRRWGRKSRRVEEDEYEDDEDEDEEEEDERPQRRRAGKTQREEPARPRKSEQRSYEEDYERYKARKAREAASAAAAPQESAPVVDPDNPFAEWDKAREKAEAEKAAAIATALPQPTPAFVPEATAPAPAPAPASTPASAPTPAPAPAAETEEFSLEDILAEFR